MKKLEWVVANALERTLIGWLESSGGQLAKMFLDKSIHLPEFKYWKSNEFRNGNFWDIWIK